MDMGTGKSKVALDTAAWLYQQGKIDLLLLIVPSTLIANWVEKEIPQHLPDACNPLVLRWQSGVETKAKTREINSFLVPLPPNRQRLKILAINVEALSTQPKHYDRKLRPLFKKLLAVHRTLAVVDESSCIKTPGSNCTRRVRGIGRQVDYRRILNGTLITNSPLDAYSQMAFLNPDILGHYSYESFKGHYAEWRIETTRAGQNYAVIDRYVRLDELHERIMRYCSRVTKDECLDLPPKVYTTRDLQMSVEQQKRYDALRNERTMWLATHDREQEEVVVKHALSIMLRMRQVLSGFLPSAVPDPGEEYPLESFMPVEKLPKVAALLDVLEQDYPNKCIVFCVYRKEVDDVVRVLQKNRVPCAGYHGGVEVDDRQALVNAFQDPANPLRVLVATRPGMRGLTLTAAKTVVFYTNSFRLDDRMQAEDRAHRIGTTQSVTYIDLVHTGTIDEKVREMLINKRELADFIHGDESRSWL